MPNLHGDQPHPRLGITLGRKVMIERLAIHLGEPLGQTQHRHRLDRLVGRDHHHRPGARRQCRIGDIHRAENVGFDAFAPVAFEDRNVLERGGVKDDIRLEFVHQPQDALAIADIRHPPLDHGAGLVRRKRFGDRIERRLRILDHQQPRSAERHDAVANLRTDRTAAAGDDDRLVLHQRFETRIIDFFAGAQQQVLDGNRRQSRRIPALQRRQAADNQPEPARPHQDGFGPRLGVECRWRHHHARDRLVAPGEIGDHVLDIVDAAEHRNVPDHLAAVGRRRRQQADRPDPLDGAAFDPTQQDFGVRGTADQQRRRRVLRHRVVPHARIAEIPVGEAQGAEKEHLEKPEQNDGHFAEKERALNIRRHRHAMNVGSDKNIVQHQQRDGQHGGHTQNVQRIREAK